MIVDTTLEAWQEVKKTLRPRQQFVYEGILYRKVHPTAAELARYLNLPVRSVAPRITELSKKGIIIRHDRRRCAVTGGSAWTWRVARQ